MQKILGAVLGVAIVAAVLGGIVFHYAERPAETPVVAADNGKTVETQKVIDPEPAEPEPKQEPAPEPEPPTATEPDADETARAPDSTPPTGGTAADLAAGDARPAADPEPDPGSGSDPGPESETGSPPAPDPALELEPGPGPGPESESEPEPDHGLEPVIPTPVSLYVFWGPFDLEGSARGFADRIAELTGLTVDVVEKTAGEYMAAFQYRTEAEKQRAIETIEKEARLKIRPEEMP